MKTLKYFILIAVSAISLSSCVVRERGGLYVRGHYDVGPYGGRHWVPAHYENR